jgi:hypothetical protein
VRKRKAKCYYNSGLVKIMRQLICCLSLAFLLAGCADIKQAAQECEAQEAAQNERERKVQNADLDKPEYVLTVQDIANKFSSNSVTAEGKCMDRVVELRGAIGSIDDSILDQGTVNILIRGNEYGIASASCNASRNSEAVRMLQKG